MTPNSKEFKKLQAKWYKKLKNSGFEDIEDTKGYLKEWSSKYLKKSNGGVKAKAKEEYYRLTGQFLYDHKFESPLEKRIWRMHAEGMSGESITAILKAKKVNIYHNKVKRIIKNLANLMVTKFTGKKDGSTDK